MWAVRAVLIAVLVIALMAFAFNNTGKNQDVEISLRPFADEVRSFELLEFAFWPFAAGVVISLLLFISTYIKLSVQLRGANKRIRALETEVAILRNRPIEESADLLKGSDKQAGNQSAFGET